MTALATTPHDVGDQPISVMVVDDSAVVRGLISRQIDAQPDMHVVSSAANGEMALVQLSRHPVDLIVLDIEMPVMDGLTALPKLLAMQPGVKVLIASTVTRRNAEISLKALNLGASDYVPKPDGGSLSNAEEFNRELLAKIRAIGGKKPRESLAPAPASAYRPMPVTPVAPVQQPLPPPSYGGPPSAPRPTPPSPLQPAMRRRPEIIAIGGSTGAPPVLIKVFEGLKGRIRQPILVTQHMPPTFTSILADHIARASGKVCAEAVDGEPVVGGRVYVAPGDYHMTVVKDHGRALIRLDQGPRENFCRPAVDPMLRSLAEAYGPGVLAIILTGMGSDGGLGCEAVAKAGGRFAVQDKESSAVWGMPAAAAKSGLAEQMLSIDQIAGFIAQVAETGV